jgi:PTS system nitrogen regulatory IIA component
LDDFSDILSPRAVATGLVVQTKAKLFQQLGVIASVTTGIEAGVIGDSIVEREQLGSTGFGGGIAIPHGKVAGLDRVSAAVVLLGTPLDFRAIDGMPVDLVFLLLSPVDAGVDHLKALARVSRRLRDRPFVAKLRGAGSADALYALLATGEERHAA